jgi:hypothetical protein
MTGVKNNERFARAGKANVNGNGLYETVLYSDFLKKGLRHFHGLYANDILTINGILRP